jgi:hypothetical protein
MPGGVRRRWPVELHDLEPVRREVPLEHAEEDVPLAIRAIVESRRSDLLDVAALGRAWSAGYDRVKENNPLVPGGFTAAGIALSGSE